MDEEEARRVTAVMNAWAQVTEEARDIGMPAGSMAEDVRWIRSRLARADRDLRTLDRMVELVERRKD